MGKRKDSGVTPAWFLESRAPGKDSGVTPAWLLESRAPAPTTQSHCVFPRVRGSLHAQRIFVNDIAFSKWGREGRGQPRATPEARQE